MPHRIAEVAAEIDARKNDVDVIPAIDSNRHAIGRRAVDAISLPERHRRARVTERGRCADRVCRRRHLDVWGHDTNLGEARRDLGQRGDAGAVDAVVVGN